MWGLLLGLAHAAWPEPPAADAAWAVVSDGTIRVECVRHDGLPWCRSSAVLGAPLSSLVAVVDDFDRYPERFEHVDHVRALDANTKYIHVDYPSPLADRDYIARFDRASRDGWFKVWWWAVAHPDAPPVDGVVRLERAAGSWELTAHPRGTHVSYVWEGEIGGDVAEWIVVRARGIMGTEVLAGLARAVGVSPEPG